MSQIICLVGDNPSLIHVLSVSLHNHGLQVLKAASSADVFGHLARHQVDMLFVDRQMANQDGLEIVEQLRQSDQYADLPVVIISTGEDLTARKKARSLGVICWLRKPIRMVDIQLAVESGIGLSSSPDNQHPDSVTACS